MNYGSVVDNGVFNSEVLEHIELRAVETWLFRINNGKDLVLIVWHDERTDAFQAKVEIVNYIARLVEKAAFSYKMWL